MICKTLPWQQTIDWCGFSWEAFAGLLAVAGAIYVGLRQIGISRDQARQLAKSAECDFALREQIEFFGLRSAFVEDFRAIWGSWSQHGELNDEELSALKALFHRAQLLYPEELADSFGEVWFQMSEKRRFAGRSQSYFEQRNDELGERDLQQSHRAEDAATELIQPLFQRIKDASRIHAP